MPSSESVLAWILDQLSDVPDVRCRPMMGEYLLYVNDGENVRTERINVK